MDEMNDLIRKRDAITSMSDLICNLHGKVPVFNEVYHAIYDIPSAEPEQCAENARWIPCSERLPEKDGRYLVTCRNWGAWTVDWNIWHNEPKQSWVYEQGVIAWMPLPEPYQEKEK